MMTNFVNGYMALNVPCPHSDENDSNTRMHSSRMRTVRNSCRLLGVLTESQTRVKT